MQRIFPMAVLILSAIGLFAFSANAQVTGGPCVVLDTCDVAELETPEWSIGGGLEDVTIVEQAGEFPGPVRTVIQFSKPPEEDPCDYHSPGTGHRWARVTLPACHGYEVRIEYNLATYDHWDPENVSSSDVFYAHVGSQPFSGNVSEFDQISCGSVGFSFTNGTTWWWGNDKIVCPATTPCVNSGEQYASLIPAGAGQHIIQVGLSTGFLYFSHGTFTISIVPLHIELLDPNPDNAGTSNPTTLIADGMIVNDPARWGTEEGTERIGVAADGTTRVVLRRWTTGPGTVDFVLDENLGGSSDLVGALSTLGGDEQVTSLSGVPSVNVDGKWAAFAVYRAPIDFAFASWHATEAIREVSLRATNHAADSGITTHARRCLEIVRPPVVLLHGLWSSSGTWDWAIMEDTRFKVHAHNYSLTNSSAYLVNRNVTQQGVRFALNLMRADGYAATRADIFGHSMGGLLARLYVTGFGSIEYLRNENFLEGDIHKLVTVCTPHKGSPLADLLFSTAPALGELAALIHATGKCISWGAVADLQPSSTAFSEWLAQHDADVASHAMVATGGSDIIAAGILSVQDAATRGFIRPLEWFGAYDNLPDFGQHDAIVGRVSQEGNIASHSSVFSYLSIFDPAYHLSVTSDSPTNIRAIELLNTLVSDDRAFAPGFPARAPSTPAVTENALGDVQLVPGVVITSPQNGFTVTPGSPIEVTVDALEGFMSSDILVVSNFDARIVDELPATVMLEVPDEAVGSFFVAAYAWEDSTGNLSKTGQIHGTSLPDAELVSLNVTPNPVLLFDFDPTKALVVMGLYDDGIERNLTDPALGTLYESNDPSIVEIDNAGVVTSVAVGTTTIDVSNGEVSTVVDVEVVSVPPPIIGDLNGDGVVNVIDMLILLDAWGTCPDPNDCPADLNGDGVVDVLDELILISNWS